MSPNAGYENVTQEAVLYTADVVYRGNPYKLRLVHDSLFLVPEAGGRPGLELTWYDVYGAEEAVGKLKVHTLEVKKGLKRKAHVYPMVLTNSESGPAVVTALQSWIATRKVEDKLKKRRIFVVVNPFGGARKARQVYANCKQFFDRCGFLEITMKETEHRYHARDMAHSLALAEFDGIVCVSGDGLVNEVVNGLLTRSDWAQARTLPVGIIPAGSGNGTVQALGMEGPEASALAIIKGHEEPFDIVGYTTEHGVVYSHMELLWTLISDMDLQSEHLRWLGPLRLEVWTIMRIIFLRRYPGRVQWLDWDQSPISTPDYTESDIQLGHGPNRHLTGPRALVGREHWKDLEGDFTLFASMNVAYLKSDINLAPHVSHKDGTMDLLFSTSACRGVFLSTALSGGERGQQARHPDVYYRKSRAFRLEPVGPQPHGGSALDIDGEHCGHGAVEAEVFPQLMRFYAPPMQRVPLHWPPCSEAVEVVCQ